ncbi:Glucose-6-phosphate 1-dehydrogenase [Clavibacter michiganensis subsp. michiganensis]|uniref:Glucose-6-phosphate 1-dehydrogenase n=1 Tax=Clavibacter michiganensis subsp. michiganensis TaxID=33013 RepID=A0A251XJ05_CLAMM|nr:Glucose-6-phosphate 1-dehydrogenase [Clavibacter michiganensis subsp. michiganensis]OUE02792.1 Glucose-6-phosphate 1-dehydrogenase [Clavibacter michiganensis subsp. michiganensis]
MSPVDITPEFNPLRIPSDRRLNRIAGPSSLIIFGVTGDLSRKKLMPAVYDLANRGLLPPGFALIGFARRDWEDQDFEQVVYEAVKQYSRTKFDEDVWRQLAQGIRFVQGTFDDDEAFQTLKDITEELDRERGTMGNHAFYLSIPPKSFPLVTEQLRRSGLADQKEGHWRRVVIEKPFGATSRRHASSTPSSSRSSRRTRCSASTTTWARRRSRTSWRCASRTSSTSPCGTPTTWTTCRSPWPRTSAWAAVPATTTASARRAT